MGSYSRRSITETEHLPLIINNGLELLGAFLGSGHLRYLLLYIDAVIDSLDIVASLRIGHWRGILIVVARRLSQITIDVPILDCNALRSPSQSCRAHLTQVDRYRRYRVANSVSNRLSVCLWLAEFAEACCVDCLLQFHVHLLSWLPPRCDLLLCLFVDCLLGRHPAPLNNCRCR